jgi:hypothetical protein
VVQSNNATGPEQHLARVEDPAEAGEREAGLAVGGKVTFMRPCIFY